MHEGILQEAESHEIDLTKYEGVEEKEGEFYTTEGVKLEKRDGELYLAEGDDVGTQILRNDEGEISSGY